MPDTLCRCIYEQDFLIPWRKMESKDNGEEDKCNAILFLNAASELFSMTMNNCST